MKKVLVQIGVDSSGGCHEKCRGKLSAAEGAEGSRSGTGGQTPAGSKHGTENPNAYGTDYKSNTPSACRYHTPHSTRHTFSSLCESYEVKETDRKRMLGHSLKGDVTIGVYGHRSVAELKHELEKIEGTERAA